MFLFSLRITSPFSSFCCVWTALFLNLVGASFTHASKSPALEPNLFDGFYIGVEGGLVNSKVKSSIKEGAIPVNTHTIDPGAVTSGSKNTKGFIFKALAGYGKEISNFYLGVEVSFAKDTISRETIALIINVRSNRATENAVYKRGIIFGFSPKFGYVFDKNLVYFTAGFEISPDKVSITPRVIMNSQSYQRKPTEVTKKTNISFTPGIGYERAINKFLVRLEYTYNLGSTIENKKSSSSLVFAKTCYRDNRFSFGLSYKL
ncbi:MAG: hypothetical protein Q8S21_03780 [Candidatus Paracaedibacteraceae bacterium]|nr:hypothetical protein [Candidatus Paracaedibacteraceae bacterium]